MSQNSLYVQQDEDAFPATSSAFMWGATTSHALSLGFSELINFRTVTPELLDISRLVASAMQHFSNMPVAPTNFSSTSVNPISMGHTAYSSLQPETLDTSGSLLTIHERLLEAMRDFSIVEDAPIYEPEPQRVNLDKLRRLRGIGASETEDLYDWYAQKEE